MTGYYFSILEQVSNSTVEKDLDMRCKWKNSSKKMCIYSHYRICDSSEPPNLFPLTKCLNFTLAILLCQKTVSWCSLLQSLRFIKDKLNPNPIQKPENQVCFLIRFQCDRVAGQIQQILSLMQWLRSCRYGSNALQPALFLVSVSVSESFLTWWKAQRVPRVGG